MDDRSDLKITGSILIVDDAATNLQLLSQVLTGRGYEVSTVTSGALALEAVQADPPDLILLDIMMPHMDGYEVCRRLKQDDRTRDIPVVFLSALGTTAAKVEGFTAGGIDYITKPFQPAEVLARVQTHLSLQNLRRGLQQEIAEREQLIYELDATNSRLRQEVAERKQAETTLHTYAERLQILHEIDQSILAVHSPEAIAVVAVGRIRQLIPCQRVMVIEMTETGETKTLAVESSSGIVSTVEVGLRHKFFEERVLRAGHVLGIGDLEALPAHSPVQKSLYGQGIRSFVVVPLFVRGELMGTLNLESQHTSVFTADHITIAIEIAALLTLAIRQARLYELAQQEIAERKQAEAMLRRYAAELETRNAELDAFAHTVAHDLKTPLTSLIGFSSLLERRYDTMSEERLVESLNFIASSGRKMTDIINELLLLSSVRKIEDVKICPLDMGAIVAEAQARLSDMIAERQAEIILPESWPVVVGYGPWIEEVWVNYISNAVKYGGQPPRVEVGVFACENGTARFWVHDNGTGLTPDQQTRLFVPFERLDQTRVEGHGLGLSIVQRIVTKLGGQVGVESKGVPGRGSTFFFTLAMV